MDAPNLYALLSADLPRVPTVDIASGEHLARLLAEILPQYRVEVERTDSDDFCYEIHCVYDGTTINVCVGEEFPSTPNGDWFVMVRPRNKSHARSPAARSVLDAINRILHDSPVASNIRWYPSFETPEYLSLTPAAATPDRHPEYEAKVHPIIRHALAWNRTSPLRFTLLFASLLVVLAGAIAKMSHVRLIGAWLFLGLLLTMIVVPAVLGFAIRKESYDCRTLADNKELQRSRK